MSWPILAIISALLFSTSNVITKTFQPKLNSGLGMFVFSIGVLITSAITAVVYKSGAAPKFSWSPVYLALAAGTVYTLAQLLFIITLAKNAPLSIAIPIIVGGIAVGGVVTGIAFFGESLSLMRIIGIVTVLIGTVILSR